MLMANTVKTFSIHELGISDDNGTFTLKTEVTQVDRDVIMTIKSTVSGCLKVVQQFERSENH